jgi:REP element-mobilizing transposase RayT
MSMAGTFSQLYIQIVFAVKGRESLIDPIWEDKLYRYITGIVTNKGQKMLAINGMPDHIHMLLSIAPTCSISDLVREVKKASNDFINRNKYLRFPFKWQSGFGAFSYSQSSLDKVILYIKNQKQHHKKRSFNEEYQKMLISFNIEYNSSYIFEKIK